jgi:hypothetical protein
MWQVKFRVAGESRSRAAVRSSTSAAGATIGGTLKKASKVDRFQHFLSFGDVAEISIMMSVGRILMTGSLHNHRQPHNGRRTFTGRPVLPVLGCHSAITRSPEALHGAASGAADRASTVPRWRGMRRRPLGATRTSELPRPQGVYGQLKATKC